MYVDREAEGQMDVAKLSGAFCNFSFYRGEKQMSDSSSVGETLLNFMILLRLLLSLLPLLLLLYRRHRNQTPAFPRFHFSFNGW